jgi:hypothetical protein
MHQEINAPVVIWYADECRHGSLRMEPMTSRWSKQPRQTFVNELLLEMRLQDRTVCRHPSSGVKCELVAPSHRRLNRGAIREGSACL